MTQQEASQQKQAFRHYVQAAEALYLKHLSARESQNYLDKAQNLYAQALELEPSQPFVLGRMARLAIKQCRFQKAEQWAKKALVLDNHCYDAWHTLGYMAYRQKNFTACIEAMTSATKIGGLRAFRSHLCLSHVHRQLSHQGAGKRDRFFNKLKSLKHLALSIVTLPFEKDRLSLSDAVIVLSRMFYGYILEEARDSERALKLYLLLSECFPGMASLNNAIGTLYRKKNQAVEAAYWFETTIRRHPSNEYAYFQLGQLLEEKGEMEKALTIYERLIELSPKDAHAHCSLANVYYGLQQFDLALSHYKAALALGQDPIWRSLLAQSIGNMHLECYNNPEAAMMAYQTAVDLNPSDVETYVQLGLLHFKQKDFNNARLIYEDAIRLSPNNPRLYSNLGYLYWMQNSIEEAETLYKQAITLDPFYEIPYNNLGVIYLDSMGKVQQAIELLEKATSLNENYALAYYNLGRAYSFLDQKLNAAQCFQMAKKLNTFTRELDNEELVARINHLFESPSLAEQE